MTVMITGLYAALLVLLSLVLAGLVGATRARKKTISLGDGGDAELLEAMRRHANLVEYVPFALILMALLEINGGSSTLLHSLGGVLLVSRLIHPFGIRANDVNRLPRLIGTLGSFGVLIVAAGVLIWGYFG